MQRIVDALGTLTSTTCLPLLAQSDATREVTLTSAALLPMKRCPR